MMKTNERQATTSNRARLQAALAGEPVTQPVYAVYDWFVQNRKADWARFFNLGLGRINHATVVRQIRPNVKIEETIAPDPSGSVRRDVRWITDKGELHEWFLGEWRQEHLIKHPQDYRVMACALSDTVVEADAQAYAASESAINDNGITLAVPSLTRTPFQAIQIDMTGLERFSLDIAVEEPALMDLIAVMNDICFREFECIAALDNVRHIKLWENLSIETMGPVLYRKHLAPVYRRLFDIMEPAGQKLCAHYDGKLRVISADIRDLAFDGIDSFTPPPEGDMSVAEARAAWPDKFLWLNPCVGWYQQSADILVQSLQAMIRDAGNTRFCLMISEDVPANPDRTIPLTLATILA